jgi:tetratricopeptide (TPR) repeat protein
MKQIAKLKDEARKHEQKEEWDKAIHAYSEVLRIGEEGDGAELDLPLYNRVGDLYVRLGRPKDAVTYYERAADKYAEVGLYNNAIALCNKALRYDSQRVDLLKKLGQFSASQGFFTDARRWYLEYSEKMSRRGEMDEAFLALAELANVQDDPEVCELLARQLKEHNRPEQAVAEYQRAYSLRVAAGELDKADAIRAEIKLLDPEAAAEGPTNGAPRESYSSAVEELPGYMDLDETPAVSMDGPADKPVPPVNVEAVSGAAPATEIAEPDASFETTDTMETRGFYDTIPVDDFGLIDLDKILLGEVPASAADFEPVDIGIEHSLEFEPPVAEPSVDEPELDVAFTEEAAADEAVAEAGDFELPTLEDFEAPQGFEDPRAMPSLDDPFAELPTLEEPPEEEDQALPALEEGVEFGEQQTGGEPMPLTFDYEPAAVDDALTDLLEAPVEEPEEFEPAAAYEPPPLEPTRAAEPVEEFVPEFEKELLSELQEEFVPEPEEEFEPLPDITPEPVPAPAVAAPAKKHSDYVDLADWLGIGEENQTEESTRFVVAEQAPTGDEEKDFADMLRQFKAKVAETIPKEDAGSHYDLGLAFKEMGLIDEAIAEFQTALRGGEEKLKVYEELGNCFVMKQQYSVAVTILNRAMQMPYVDEGELLGVFYNLGRAHEELGQRSEAKAAYERVISVDIGFADAAERLSKL